MENETRDTSSRPGPLGRTTQSPPGKTECDGVDKGPLARGTVQKRKGGPTGRSGSVQTRSPAERVSDLRGHKEEAGRATGSVKETGAKTTDQGWLGRHSNRVYRRGPRTEGAGLQRSMFITYVDAEEQRRDEGLRCAVFLTHRSEARTRQMAEEQDIRRLVESLHYQRRQGIQWEWHRGCKAMLGSWVTSRQNTRATI